MGSSTPQAEFGPATSGGRSEGRRRARTLAVLVGATLLSVVLVVGTVNLAVLWQGVTDVERVPLVTRTDIPLATDAPPSFEPVDVEPVLERTTILLVGSDSREGLSPAQLAAIGTTDHGSDLTDTIILLQLDPAQDSALMLSFPRDLWVEHCNGQPGRINAAFATGEAVLGEGMGPSCLMTTVETMAGVGIDHYVRLDFAGFVEAIDAVGGVTFHVDQPLQDAAAGLDLDEGCVDFDGVTAIQFVRARSLDSDLGRVARQQRFAVELVDQITSVGTMANPLRLQRLVSAISGSLQTDDAFGAPQLLELAQGLRDLSAEGLQAETLPVADERIAGQAVLVPIAEDAEAAYAPFRDPPPADDLAEEPGMGRETGAPAGPGTPSASPTPADGSSPVEAVSPTPPVEEATAADDPPAFVGAERSDTVC